MDLKKLTPDQVAATERFVKFITCGCDFKDVSSMLDYILWELVNYKLQDEGFTGFDGGANDVYLLRQLAELFGGRVRWSEIQSMEP